MAALFGLADDVDADFAIAVAPVVELLFGEFCFKRSEQIDGVRLSDFSINFSA